MYLTIVQTLRDKSPAEVARLIRSAPQYITNNDLIGVINQFIPNDDTNHFIVLQQVNMFSGVIEIREQVEKWLAS